MGLKKKKYEPKRVTEILVAIPKGDGSLDVIWTAQFVFLLTQFPPSSDIELQLSPRPSVRLPAATLRLTSLLI
jgi:hypothetical protein